MREVQLVTEEKMRISSRDIADMLEVKHDTILRKLSGRKNRRGIIDILNDNQLSVVDYFIKSTYTDAKGEERPEYLVSKMGCDFLANKFQGEKGIVFTAKYVLKFEQMKTQIVKDSYQIQDPIERAKAWVKEQERTQALLHYNKELEEENEVNKTIIDTMMSDNDLRSIFLVGKVLKTYNSDFGAKKIFKYLRDIEWLMNRKGSQLNNTPFDIHSDKFEVKLIGNNIITYFNKKGLKCFLNKVIRDGLIEKTDKKSILVDIEKEVKKNKK